MKGRLPAWFKQEIPSPQKLQSLQGLLSELDLHTICESAHCPNIGGCSARDTATFLILGDRCTRRCSFCAVTKGIPSSVDADEPQHLLEAVEKLDLRYVVVTSVTRDDLVDGGATHFAAVINLLHERRPGIIIEVLVPDFLGSRESLEIIVEAGPEVINHNVETVPRLYPEVRPIADYPRSLLLLSEAKKLAPSIVTKSGMMLGLGETKEEVIGVMEDLRKVDCDLLTIGQYLQPSPAHHAVARFVHPGEFLGYAEIGRAMGFRDVASAPLVRSSYKAAELFSQVRRP